VYDLDRQKLQVALRLPLGCTSILDPILCWVASWTWFRNHQ